MKKQNSAFLIKKIIISTAFLTLCFLVIPINAALYLKEENENAKAAQDQVILQNKNRIEYEANLTEKLQNKKSVLGIMPNVPTPSLVSGEVVAFEIKTISVRGNTVLPQSRIESVVKPYEGKYLDVNHINQIISELTRVYFDMGYVTTRVFLPKQNLKEGVMVLQVQEGTIEIFKGYGISPLQLDLAFTGLKGRVLNIHDLDQGVEQFNRLGSNSAILALMPSEDKVGGSVIGVKNEAGKKVSGRINYDNFTTNGYSIVPTSLDVVFDNLFEALDQWGVNYSQKFENKTQFQNSTRLSSSFAWGYFTPRISYSFFNYLTLVDNIYKTRKLSTTGTNEAWGLGLDWTLLRGRGAKTLVKADFQYKDVSNYIEDSLVGVNSDRLAVLKLALSQTVRSDWSNLSLELGYSYGERTRKITEAENIRDGDTPIPSKLKYQKLKGDISLNIPLISSQNMSFIDFSMSGQYGFDALISSEGFVIGDFYSVRGFTASYFGDTGAVGSVKLTIPVKEVRNMSVSFQSDAGYAWRKDQWSASSGRAYMTGISLGVTYRDFDWTMDAVAAKGLWASSSIPIEPAQYYFSFSKRF